MCLAMVRPMRSFPMLVTAPVFISALMESYTVEDVAVECSSIPSHPDVSRVKMRPVPQF